MRFDMTFFKPNCELALTQSENNKSEQINEELIKDELNWNFTNFISKILFNAKPEWKLTESVIKKEIKLFNKRNRCIVDYNRLLGKQWLRLVLEEIEIPYAINNIIYNLESKIEIKEKYGNEDFWYDLCFLSEIKKKYGYKDSRKWIVSKSAYSRLCISFKCL